MPTLDRRSGNFKLHPAVHVEIEDFKGFTRENSSQLASGVKSRALLEHIAFGVTGRNRPAPFWGTPSVFARRKECFGSDEMPAAQAFSLGPGAPTWYVALNEIHNICTSNGTLGAFRNFGADIMCRSETSDGR
jgi:hypothetical protein